MGASNGKNKAESFLGCSCLDAESLVDGQDLEHERKVTDVLLVSEVVGVCFQQLDQKHAWIFRRPVNSVNSRAQNN